MLENKSAMNKATHVRSVVEVPVEIHPAISKRRYIRPFIDILSVSSTCSLLSDSQGPWGDAKPRNPDIGNNLWDDETVGSDNPADESSNWTGYQQDMSIW